MTGTCTVMEYEHWGPNVKVVREANEKNVTLRSEAFHVYVYDGYCTSFPDICDVVDFIEDIKSYLSQGKLK